MFTLHCQRTSALHAIANKFVRKRKGEPLAVSALPIPPTMPTIPASCCESTESDGSCTNGLCNDGWIDEGLHGQNYEQKVETDETVLGALAHMIKS